jgi:sphingomyelin phosphodiesterase acid-like 3
MAEPNFFLARGWAAVLLLWLALAGAAAGAEPASRNQLLVASDIHFDPTADASLVPELAKADPTMWESILERSQPRRFSVYRQDPNWWLLQSALDQMHKTMPHPALFLLLGDLLVHGFPQKFQDATHDTDLQHYRAFVQKTVQFLALELRQRWPETQILITPGNNDDDCQDYSIYANGVFLQDSAASTRELGRGDEQLAANWKALGSYSVMPPKLAGLRIVSVNTVFFSARYQARDLQSGCAAVASNAPEETFAWLEQSLREAQKAQQKVWLMFHIPPGIDGWASTHPAGGPVPPVGEECVKSIVPMWTPEWTVRFEKLLASYGDTVVATFAGHTHVDNFLAMAGGGGHSGAAAGGVMGGGDKSQFVLIDPPVSPIYDQNPAFRVVNFASDYELHNYATYYLTNLTAHQGKLRGKWKKEYDFGRTWKARPVNAATLGKVYAEIAGNAGARQQWLRLYNVTSEAAKTPAAIVPGLYCVIENQSVEGYGKCACGSPE